MPKGFWWWSDSSVHLVGEKFVKWYNKGGLAYDMTSRVREVQYVTIINVSGLLLSVFQSDSKTEVNGVASITRTSVSPGSEIHWRWLCKIHVSSLNGVFLRAPWRRGRLTVYVLTTIAGQLELRNIRGLKQEFHPQPQASSYATSVQRSPRGWLLQSLRLILFVTTPAAFVYRFFCLSLSQNPLFFNPYYIHVGNSYVGREKNIYTSDCNRLT